MSMPRQLAKLRPNDLVLDIDSADVPPEIWTDAYNVNFRSNHAERVGGWAPVWGTPVGPPVFLMYFIRSLQPYWIYATSDNKVGIWNGAAHHDITPATPPAPGSGMSPWSGTVFNGVPVLNWQTAAPHYWDGNLTNPMVPIPGWVDGDKCDTIRSYKNYLIALGYEDSSLYNPNLVRWSDRAAPGSLPSTWVPAADNDAGFIELSATAGPIVDGAPLRDQFMVYKRNSTYALDFIGGGFIFRGSKLFVNTGALARNCIAEHRGVHYVFSEADIIAHDGHDAASLVDRRIKRTIFDNINGDRFLRSFVALYNTENEVWFCYPRVGSEWPNIAAIWNYEEQKWGIRELSQTPHAAQGIVQLPAGTGPISWDAQVTEWDATQRSWVQDLTGVAEDRLVLADNDAPGKFYFVDAANDLDETPVLAWLSRHSLDFGEPDRVKTVKAIWPRMTDAGGQFRIRVGTQMEPFEAIRWTPWKTWRVGDRKSDVFATGRYISVEIESNGGGTWRCSGFDVELRMAGRY